MEGGGTRRDGSGSENTRSKKHDNTTKQWQRKHQIEETRQPRRSNRIQRSSDARGSEPFELHGLPVRQRGEDVPLHGGRLDGAPARLPHRNRFARFFPREALVGEEPVCALHSALLGRLGGPRSFLRVPPRRARGKDAAWQRERRGVFAARRGRRRTGSNAGAGYGNSELGDRFSYARRECIDARDANADGAQ